ncbi:DUF3037 domain-containing protein [Pseudoalteromonas atlantica]|uniref:DUF3037 domain-containing protein n=1 Tax=Pseudoalteromonas atlantica TaxID=288 RepID=UPI003A9866CD
MKNLVRYSVIRFMPFTETQEFANVGVVLHAPNDGKVLFKLANKRFARVSNFFDDLDGQLYSNAIEMFTSELQRVKDFTYGIRGRELTSFMDEVTRKKEGFLTYSDTAALLTTKAFDEVLDDLFKQYVGRNFNTKEHRESLILRNVKSHLDKVSKYKYTKRKLDASYMSFELPLVAKNEFKMKAVKPLSFHQDSPLKLIDHGEFWISRVKHLLNSDVIKGTDFLFVVDKPKFKSTKLYDAFNSLSDEMINLGVNVLDFKEINKIDQFTLFDCDKPENFKLI